MPEPITRILREPPSSMAFELSEAGTSEARLNARTELDSRPLKPGVLAITPLKAMSSCPMTYPLQYVRLRPKTETASAATWPLSCGGPLAGGGLPRWGHLQDR